jgi:hypothetical protein
LSHPIDSWDEKGTLHIDALCRYASDVPLDKPTSSLGTVCRPKYNDWLTARLKTVTGRDLRNHDADAEKKQRAAVTAAHSYS